MFFFNEKLKQIIKNYFGFTEDMIQDMQELYTQKLMAMMVNTALEFMDNNHLEAEQKKLEELTNNSSQDLKLLEQIYQFVLNIYHKNPEVQKIYTDKMNELNKELMKDWVDAIDEPTAIKIMEVAQEDATLIQEVEQYIDKAKKQLNPESSSINSD